MRKSVPIALLVVFVFVLIAFAPELEPGKAVPDFVFEEPAKVIKVKDGDTFAASWESGYIEEIRLDGISARKPRPYKCYSTKVTVWLFNLIYERWVWLKEPQKQDLRHNSRLVARVYLDSDCKAHLGKIMVAQGIAEVDTDFFTGRELQPLESKAEEAKRGLWGAC